MAGTFPRKVVRRNGPAGVPYARLIPPWQKHANQNLIKMQSICICLYSSVVERQSCKLKVLGSIPSGGFFEKQAFDIARRRYVCPIAAAQDSLAERSKAVA